jgi:hypothetical protein
MARNRYKGNRIGGPFLALPRDVINHAAFLRLSPFAKSLLIDLGAQYKGDNNGDLSCAWKVMKPRLAQRGDAAQGEARAAAQRVHLRGPQGQAAESVRPVRADLAVARCESEARLHAGRFRALRLPSQRATGAGSLTAEERRPYYAACSTEGGIAA